MFNVAIRFSVIVYVGAVLTGCATVHESYAPDGRKAYALNCSGLARGWDKCQVAAGEICGAAGYDIIDRASEASGMVMAGANASGGFGSAARSNERSMLIACKVKQ